MFLTPGLSCVFVLSALGICASFSPRITTKQVRLGGDSQMTFGHCALCVHPAVDPMATPSGHIYCKECIVEFLLAKTQELKRQKEAFEAQEKAKGEIHSV